MMKTRYMLMLAAAAVLASCARENLEPEVTAARTWRFTATAADPMTKSFFKDTDEAPSRWIYWDAEDEFDFHDIALGEDGAETVTVTSGKPVQVAVDQKSVLFEQTAHDYMVITYPKGAATVQGDVVTVAVPRDQPLSSVLSPAAVPMSTRKIALSDAAVRKIGTEGDVAVAFQNPVKVYPLAGLVKMTVKGLPEVASAKITKVVVMSDFSYKAGDPQVGLRGENTFSLGEGLELASTFASGDQYVRNDITLSGGTVDYTAADGADICFIADESSVGMKTLQVALFTEDGAIYKKKFDTSTAVEGQNAGLIGFSKSKVTTFTVDFTDGTVSKVATKQFAVEWSSGYLVYDEENKGYKFGGPFDIGLYFKFGSAVGFRFYASTEAFDAIIRPKDENGEFFSGSAAFNKGGQTLGNGTDMFYSGMLNGGKRFYPLENSSWRETVYYRPEGGSIVAATLPAQPDGSAPTAYYALQGSTEFKDATDPCSYVKVGSGEKSWRVPTLDEIKDLIEVGAAGLEFGNTDGSDMKSSDGKSRYLHYTDGVQSFYLKAAGSVSTTYSKEYSVVQHTYGNKYAPRFWSTSYSGETTTPPTKTTNGAQAFNINASSPFSMTSTPTTAAYAANRYNQYGLESKRNAASESAFTGDYYLWEAVPVRCVRDKN